ncbi:protein FAR1-RELATED SEQUENCE 5-like [Cornus florida]|uniref:protein FAR1-RELATED SEQUENCE 5-like n=1 Tax=Cornus florida TaxID=4283 RepID=UPI00289E16DB|nr:protein FAR1-RELATED SEQUENCE 5-like [Cornus florida]
MNDVEKVEIGKEEEIYNPQVAHEKKPRQGKEFKSLDDSYKFYNKYVREASFSVRIDKSKKKQGTGEIYWKQYVCFKESETDETYKRKKEKEIEMNENLKDGWKARLTVVKREEHYVVTHFIKGHNHPLATPSKVHLLRSHRNVSNAKRKLTQQLANVNVPIYQQFDILETQAGGIQNVRYTERDLRNYERDIREKLKGHDAHMMNEYFLSEKEKNPSLFFEIDTDENDRINRYFWVDPHARKAYNFFNDVVVFDMTYNTNRYSLIFAPLTGVNHHGKTIIFGCGFLSDETTELFVWLFETWLKAMPKGPPNVIITDQDSAMAKAISQTLPHTLHRYCIWHILKNFPEKLDSIMFRDHYFLYQASIWKSDTTEEFKESWKNALEKSGQQGNDWLRTMYALCDKWVPTYVNKFFSARMSSSQRAESAHSFFKKLTISTENENQCSYEAKVVNGGSEVRRVVYDKINEEVKCSCQSFEFEGKYGVEIKDVQDKLVMVRRTKLLQLASTIVDEVVILEEGTELLTKTLETVYEQLKVMNSSQDAENNGFEKEKQWDMLQQRIFNDSLQVRAKGCGKHLRSWREKGKSKRRHCHGYGKVGQSHDKRNFSKLNNTSNINSDEDIASESKHTDHDTSD